MDDTIKKSDAIKAIAEYFSDDDDSHWNAIATYIIKDIPSVEKQGEWIPCSERMPEEHEWIGTKEFGTTISDKVHITFDVNGKRFVKTLSLQNGELSISDKQRMDAFHKGWKMLAWMPLPGPMKGADDE